MSQCFRIDDEHRPLHVGADSISARKVCGGLCLPRASNARPYRPFPIVFSPHSSLISQPIILQPPLQLRLVGYENALLQG